MKRCKLLTTLAQSNATDSNSCLRHIDGICRINWRACGTAEALRNAVGVRADRARQAIAVDVVVSHGSAVPANRSSNSSRAASAAATRALTPSQVRYTSSLCPQLEPPNRPLHCCIDDSLPEHAKSSTRIEPPPPDASP